MHRFTCIEQGFVVPGVDAVALRIEPICEITSELWLQSICAAYDQGRYHVIHSARIISAARRALPHREWARLLRMADFPHSKKKADSLVRIGDQLGELPDEYVRTHFPTALRTLFQLSLLDRAALAGFVSADRIHKELTEGEAAALVREFRGLPPNEDEKPTKLEKWLLKGVKLLENPDSSPSGSERRLALKLLRIIGERGARSPDPKHEDPCEEIMPRLVTQPPRNLFTLRTAPTDGPLAA